MRGTLWRCTRPLLGLAITGSFLWLLLGQVDVAEIGTALSHLSLWSLVVAVGFLAAGYTVRVIRWWWMLRVLDPHIPLSACGWPFLVSIAVNNLLPFRAGDALRVVGFRRRLRAPVMRLLGTLIIERLLDLLTLLTFFFVGLRGVADGRVPETFVHLATWITAAGVVTVLAILLLSRWIEWVFRGIAEHAYLATRGWSDSIKHHGSHFLNALGLLRTPSLTLQLIVLSIVVWGFEGAVFATVAQGLSTKSSAAGPWFALATGTLATLLPSSPGYVGTFDYFAMLGLMAYGAERATAAAFAVIVHAVLWLPLTVGGMTYFLRPGARMLRRQATAAVSAQEDSM